MLIFGVFIFDLWCVCVYNTHMHVYVHTHTVLIFVWIFTYVYFSYKIGIVYVVLFLAFSLSISCHEHFPMSLYSWSLNNSELGSNTHPSPTVENLCLILQSVLHICVLHPWIQPTMYPSIELGIYWRRSTYKWTHSVQTHVV